MNRSSLTVLFAAAVLGLGPATAHAGPCSNDIAAFENAARESARNVDAGPMARQTVGSQLHHQPTPGSVAEAQARADQAFDSVLARAKSLDQQNDPACAKALDEAKATYESD